MKTAADACRRSAVDAVLRADPAGAQPLPERSTDPGRQARRPVAALTGGPRRAAPATPQRCCADEL